MTKEKTRYYRTQEQKRWMHSNGNLSELAAKYGCTKIQDLEKKEKAKAIR
jgi:hypothetical protein